MPFTSLGLSEPILKAIAETGYDTPTPIQAQAIPVVLAGRDVMAAAQTGTGKTAGFTLPLLEMLSKGTSARPNGVRALILTPTRELAAQVEESVVTYGKHLKLRSAVVFGGVKINPQMMQLRKGADILVATPGRLLDLHQQNAVKFDQLEVLILDEADRMLDMGFINPIRKIIELIPARRQTLMFSATFSDSIRKLAQALVRNPVEISVSPPNATANTVEQWVYPVDKKRKPHLLQHLIETNNWQQVLVFCKTKHGANRLAQDLNHAKIHAAPIHGNKSQGARTKALADFKSGAVRVLVATDIAARGLDIDQLPQVVNYELPNVPEDYVHRIGRTGRAGMEGQAISLVCAEEFPYLVDIENLTKKIIPRTIVTGYQPVETVPESRLGLRVAKPKGPAQRQGRNEQRPASPRSGQKNGGPKNGGQRSEGQRSEGQKPRSPGSSQGGKPQQKKPSPQANGNVAPANHSRAGGAARTPQRAAGTGAPNGNRQSPRVRTSRPA